MKICRVKEIKNIGTFVDFNNGASHGFEKLTFIHGLNTYGKTTLADIFQSLKTNSSSIISNRRTIPAIAFAQKVNISIKETDTEKDLTFQNSSWGNNAIAPHLEVFGTDFIHNNVFTGLNIERKNKENLTSFILGDQGVRFAEEIKDKKKTLSDKKREMKEKIPQFVKYSSENEINKFIEFSFSELDREKIERNIIQKKSLLQKEQDRLKEPAKIINLEEPIQFTHSKLSFIETIEIINDLLSKDYVSIKEESIKKLNEHIKNNFHYNDNSKNWIQQGLNYCKDKALGNCPFCGQDLKNANDLINLYGSYFDKAYTDFIEEVTTGLNINIEILKNSRLNNYTRLQSALLKINLYKDQISKDDFQIKLQELEKYIANLNENEIEIIKNDIIQLLENKILDKNKAPYEKCGILDFSEFQIKVNEYENALNECEKLIEIFLDEIKEFKKQYNNTSTIQQSIQNLNDEIKTLEYQIARIDQNNDCKEYKKLVNAIDELENGDSGIKKLEDNLQKEQTDFLKKYFSNINDLFARFGSKNFTLEKEEDKRGHLPVYSLKVKFHNKEIPSDQLCTVFSESDRRAIALAIFFAKIELKTDDEKKNTVIILDDPVTSFDDNRTTNSINYFKGILDKTSQLIILTHYIHFIKRFCEITKKNHITTKFINIKQNDFTSYLETADRDEFILSEYEKIFMKIYNFINKKHTDCIKTDLRPFLECYYLPIVFNKQIQDSQIDCGNLENMINGIFSNNENVKNKFHELRNTLNPDSHIFTTNNPEDVRNFAEDMFNFLYSIEFTNKDS